MSVPHHAKTPAWPPRSAPRLFVPQRLEAGIDITVTAGQWHYLTKVMRVKVSDIVILCDDQTGEWAATVTATGKRDMILTVDARLRPRENVPDFWLCPALLKKDHFDLVLEKATELGVRRISPIITRRCVANRLNDKRARVIITEAAEQCARTALPQLTPAEKLPVMLAGWPVERILFFADEQGGAPADTTFRKNCGPSALITGPEGGFDETERAALLAHPNVRPITLGPRILRGETATLAAIALWMGIAGDW